MECICVFVCVGVSASLPLCVRVYLFMCEMCDVLWDICVSVHMFVPRQDCIIADGNQLPDNDNLLTVLLLTPYLHMHNHTHNVQLLVRDGRQQRLKYVVCYMAGRLGKHYLWKPKLPVFSRPHFHRAIDDLKICFQPTYFEYIFSLFANKEFKRAFLS